MSTGYVKFFDEEKRYGFIYGKRGEPDIFFHEKVIEGGRAEEGQEVEYQLFPMLPPEKPKALRVQVLDKQAYIPITQGQRKQAAHGD